MPKGERVRLASFDKDYWELRNGEECHEKDPDTFWIPSLEERKSLRRGMQPSLYSISNVLKKEKLLF